MIWTSGMTAKGSSGSGLVNSATGQVMAVLSGVPTRALAVLLGFSKAAQFVLAALKAPPRLCRCRQ